jgi:hypothetical protein
VATWLTTYVTAVAIAPAAAHRSGCTAPTVRPTIMPRHRNANHGSNGCVPLTKVSSNKPRGDSVVSVPGDVSQSTEWPSTARSTTHHRTAAAATAALLPMTTSHRVRNVKTNAATTNVAP